MSYSFFLLKKEERLLGRYSKHDNFRCVFTEDEFRALPVFDCMPDNSPYFTEIYSQKENKHLSDVIPMYVHGKREFTSREEYLKRLQTVTGGIIDDIDLDSMKVYMTGSSIVPCVVTNPLEENYMRDGQKRFDLYVEDKYPSYKSIHSEKEDYYTLKHDFLQRMKNSRMVVPLNILNDDIFIEFLQSTTTFYKFMKNLKTKVLEAWNIVCVREEAISDIDIAIISKSHEDYEQTVFALFEKIKINVAKKNATENKPLAVDSVYLHKKQLKWGFKYVVKGRDILRPLDLFRINISIPNLLFGFHENIVRFWWDGKIVRGLASGVCTALTGINEFRRWVSNNKDPLQICLRIAERGYTLLLTIKEYKALILYTREVPMYNHLYKHIILGAVNKQHVLFTQNRPTINGGIRFKLNVSADFNHTCVNINDEQNWKYQPLSLTYNKMILRTNIDGRILVPRYSEFRTFIITTIFRYV
jgi:hypothetical protein